MISPILSHNTENESSAITVNQNILNYILFIQSKDDEFFRETILSLNLSVLTCTCSTVSHDFLLLQHFKFHIRLILSTAFNFLSNYTVGCIS